MDCLRCKEREDYLYWPKYDRIILTMQGHFRSIFQKWGKMKTSRSTEPNYLRGWNPRQTNFMSAPERAVVLSTGYPKSPWYNDPNTLEIADGRFFCFFPKWDCSPRASGEFRVKKQPRVLWACEEQVGWILWIFHNEWAWWSQAMNCVQTDNSALPRSASWRTGQGWANPWNFVQTGNPHAPQQDSWVNPLG